MGRALLNVPTLVLLEHAAEVRPALGLDVGLRALTEVGLDAGSLLVELDSAVSAARAAEVSRALARSAIREAAAQRKEWLRDTSAWGRSLRSLLALVEGELARSAARAVAGCLVNNWGQRFDAARRSLATTMVTLRTHETTLRLGPTHATVVAGKALATRVDALASEQQRVTDELARASAAAVAARARLLEQLRRIHRSWQAAVQHDRLLPDLPTQALRDHQPRARAPRASESELEGGSSELEGGETVAEGGVAELEGDVPLLEGGSGELRGGVTRLGGGSRELVGESVVVITTRASIQ